MFFNRDPLERVWIKLEKYEGALGSIKSTKPRLAKRITGALRNSLQRELDRRRIIEGAASTPEVLDAQQGLTWCPQSSLPSPGHHLHFRTG